MFTLREVECLGSCANAPMIQVMIEFEKEKSRGEDRRVEERKTGEEKIGDERTEEGKRRLERRERRGKEL